MTYNTFLNDGALKLHNIGLDLHKYLHFLLQCGIINFYGSEESKYSFHLLYIHHNTFLSLQYPKEGLISELYFWVIHRS